MTALTAAINLLPNNYDRLEQMGLMPENPVHFRSIAVEEKNGVLTLLPTLPVGAPGTVGKRGKRALRTFTVYRNRKDRLPALYVGSRIPWLGIHEKGGTIGRRMLIPLLSRHQRIDRKAFRRMIDNLMHPGNAFFIERNGRAILMAENLRENDRALARFKRSERLRTGQKRLRRGQEIPVAVLVDSVRLRKRFDLESAVRRKLPRLARIIQREIQSPKG
jgi:hypothetical protein